MGFILAQGQGIVVSLDRFGPNLGGWLGSLACLAAVGLICLAIKLSMTPGRWKKRKRRWDL